MKVPATKISFSEKDIAYVIEHFTKIMRGESFLSMGKFGEEFEAGFAKYVGTKYAVACNSGTSALEMICRGLELAGKEVIMPSNTFVATANAIMNASATPVFADCGDDMCMTLDAVKARVTAKTAAVMQVHIGGVVSKEVPRIKAFCAEKKIHFIEDAAQAHGSSLDGVQAGAFGVAAGFSFFSTKVMTTGEGGMVTTNDEKLATTMKSMREFGKVRNDVYINYYDKLGYNWRMPEVSALMGLMQLRALPDFIARRQQIARLYDQGLEGTPGITLVRPPDPKTNNYFKYTILLSKQDRPTIHRALLANDVQPSGYVYELPLHKQPIFPADNALSLPTTEKVCGRHMCMPIYPEMTDDQVRYVCTTLKKVLAENPG